MIYVASPYWHDDPAMRDERFRAACRATVALLREGHTAFSPIVFGHALVPFGLPAGWEFWQQHDRDYLARCDEVAVLRVDGWRDSEGVRAELAVAAALGMSVRYLDPEA